MQIYEQGISLSDKTFSIFNYLFLHICEKMSTFAYREIRTDKTRKYEKIKESEQSQ